jgi:transcriptional regulator with GAF, ATPase, and Fis domain
VKKYGAKLGKNIEIIPQQVMDVLQAYSWPGNVRELENIIERTTILAWGSTLELDDSFDALHEVEWPSTNLLTLEEVERNHILGVLEQTNWRIEGQQGAALRLGLNPNTLRSRLKKLGITKP